jgi:hypothetical protein
MIKKFLFLSALMGSVVACGQNQPCTLDMKRIDSKFDPSATIDSVYHKYNILPGTEAKYGVSSNCNQDAVFKLVELSSRPSWMIKNSGSNLTYQPSRGAGSEPEFNFAATAGVSDNPLNSSRSSTYKFRIEATSFDGKTISTPEYTITSLSSFGIISPYRRIDDPVYKNSWTVYINLTSSAAKLDYTPRFSFVTSKETWSAAPLNTSESRYDKNSVSPYYYTKAYINYGPIRNATSYQIWVASYAKYGEIQFSEPMTWTTSPILY